MICRCPRCGEEFDAEIGRGVCPECGMPYSFDVTWETPEDED